ncbi:MAG: hypothetical protein PF692_07355 [Kiritimatiellae bacterium]|jgi:membrane-bound serine protease (ClpP class)|nr:hypothetical protein [Kiritimatiellia bacterium]
MTLIQVFYILLVTGVLLLSLEIFVPGGILGTIGGLMLISTIFMSLFIFDKYGVLIAFLIMVFSVAMLVAWIAILPKTPLGKRITLNHTLVSAKSNSDRTSLVGREGITVSELRPSGFAKIDGKKYDVLSDGGLISVDKEIVVTNVSGIRIIVQEKPEAGGASGDKY